VVAPQIFLLGVFLMVSRVRVCCPFCGVFSLFPFGVASVSCVCGAVCVFRGFAPVAGCSACGRCPWAVAAGGVVPPRCPVLLGWFCPSDGFSPPSRLAVLAAAEEADQLTLAATSPEAECQCLPWDDCTCERKLTKPHWGKDMPHGGIVLPCERRAYTRNRVMQWRNCPA